MPPWEWRSSQIVATLSRQLSWSHFRGVLAELVREALAAVRGYVKVDGATRQYQLPTT
jgi:hypothetical protein